MTDRGNCFIFGDGAGAVVIGETSTHGIGPTIWVVTAAARRRYGRTSSAASIPLAMEKLLATGAAKGGSIALLLGYGSGLSYSASVVTLPGGPVNSASSAKFRSLNGYFTRV